MKAPRSASSFQPSPRARRGAAPLLVPVLLAAMAVGVVVPNWRPWNWAVFQKPAPTAALAQAQADLAKAQADAKAAQDALKATQAAELAKKEAQLRYAQQMSAGASEALKTAPDVPPVKVALGLLDRTNHGLAAAIGDLPDAKQAEIVQLVNQSLSGLASDLAAANAALAAKDKELTIATTERTALQAQIPALQKRLDATTAQVQAQTATVATKTQEVVTFAEKAAAKEREGGSLRAQVDNLGRLLLLAGLGYLFVHFLLPSLAAEYPGIPILAHLNKTLKSLTSAHT